MNHTWFYGGHYVSVRPPWSDRIVASRSLNSTSEGEPRFLLIGKIAEKHWSAVVTYRDARIRLISVRRSRKKEVELYES